MPRKVTISAEVGVLTNSSSTPAAFEYWREWARKMLRLQKPDPCVDRIPAAARAALPNIIPGPAAIAIVVVAMAPFRNLRRDEAAVSERSTPVRLGKCVQPVRSHMLSLLFQSCRPGCGERGNWHAKAAPYGDYAHSRPILLAIPVRPPCQAATHSPGRP